MCQFRYNEFKWTQVPTEYELGKFLRTEYKLEQSTEKSSNLTILSLIFLLDVKVMKMTRITEKEEIQFGDSVWRFKMEALFQIHYSH